MDELIPRAHTIDGKISNRPYKSTGIVPYKRSPIRAISFRKKTAQSTASQSSKQLPSTRSSVPSVQLRSDISRLKLRLSGKVTDRGLIRIATSRRRPPEAKSVRSCVTSRNPTPVRLPSKQHCIFELVKNNDLEGLKRIRHTISSLDANTFDEQGNSPIYYAAQNSLAMTELLVNLGAKVNCSCERGNTPLHAAFASDMEEVIIYLIQQGADLTRRNRAEAVPIDRASDRIRGNLGLKEEETSSYNAQELIRRLKLKPINARTKPNEAKKATKVQLVLYQFPRSVTEGRILLRERKIRRNSPLYPSPMRSGVKFQGESLSPEDGSSIEGL